MKGWKTSSYFDYKFAVIEVLDDKGKVFVRFSASTDKELQDIKRKAQTIIDAENLRHLLRIVKSFGLDTLSNDINKRIEVENIDVRELYDRWIMFGRNAEDFAYSISYDEGEISEKRLHILETKFKDLLDITERFLSK